MLAAVLPVVPVTMPPVNLVDLEYAPTLPNVHVRHQLFLRETIAPTPRRAAGKNHAARLAAIEVMVPGFQFL